MLGTRFDIDYPRSDLTGMRDAPSRVVLVQEVNKHDLLLVDHIGSPTYLEDTLRAGAPVTFRSLSEAGSRQWHGYVDTLVPIEFGYAPESKYLIDTDARDGGNTASTQVVCVGTTYPLKRSMTTGFSGITTCAVVTSLVKDDFLLPVVSPCDMVQTVSPADRSVWQVITDLGQMSGRLTFSTGTTVNWLTPDDIMHHFAISAPELVHYSQSGSALDLHAMVTWEESVSDNRSHTPDQWRTKTTMAAVDPVTGVTLKQKVGEGMFERTLLEVARSSTSLQTKLKASHDLAFNRSAITAGPGNPYVRAGMPVFMRAPSGHRWWLVKRVEHVWYPHARTYQMEVTLMQHDSLAQPSLGKYPEVSLSRHSAYGSPQFEFDPTLEGASRSLVVGAGVWGTMDRWVARTYV